jgi:hypothetical protein
VVAIGLAACKTETPEEKQARICRETPVPPHLNTTISSDGKVVAVMSYVDKCGKKRVRYKHLDPEGAWQELSIPMGVDSIRFGFHAHELMFTRRVRPGDGTWLGNLNKVDSWGALYKVDLDHPEQEPQTIYEAYGLILPVEVTPGVIMVQDCVPTTAKQCHGQLGWQWNLIKDGKLIHRWPYGGPDGNRGNMNFGWPNVVPGQGAFWFKVRGYYKEGEPFPDFWRLAFPGKTAPIFTETLSEDSDDLTCDYQAERCLRTFHRDRRDERHAVYFEYDHETLWRREKCQIEGVAGFTYDKSLSPDGLFSVLSLVIANERKPHVVVIRFSAHQCKPTRIQHFQLEE